MFVFIMTFLKCIAFIIKDDNDYKMKKRRGRGGILLVSSHFIKRKNMLQNTEILCKHKLLT